MNNREMLRYETLLAALRDDREQKLIALRHERDTLVNEIASAKLMKVVDIELEAK